MTAKYSQVNPQKHRRFQVIRLARTEKGVRQWEVTEFERTQTERQESMDPTAYKALENAIREQKKAIEAIEGPEYYEVAIVTPTPDYLLRRTKTLLPLVTLDLSTDSDVLASAYYELFYKKFNIVADLVCQCVRDPENLDIKLFVPDDTKKLKQGQLRLSDWNIPIDLALIQEQGYISPLPTPTCAVLWIACINAGCVKITPKEEKKGEEDDNLESFPEATEELASDPEDMVLEGVPELSE